MRNINVSVCNTVELSINNDESRVIRFDPSSKEFAERYYTMMSNYGKCHKEAARKIEEVKTGGLSEMEKMSALLDIQRDIFRELRTEIDNVFGAGTSDTVFGEHNSFGAFASFFQGLKPYVENARMGVLSEYLQGKEGKESAIMEM